MPLAYTEQDVALHRKQIIRKEVLAARKGHGADLAKIIGGILAVKPAADSKFKSLYLNRMWWWLDYLSSWGWTDSCGKFYPHHLKELHEKMQ